MIIDPGVTNSQKKSETKVATQSQNPSTGRVIRTFADHSTSEVDDRIIKSHNAFLELKTWSLERRAKYMMKAASILRNEAEQAGKIITLEMGKTLKSAVAEVNKSAVGAEYYARTASTHLKDDIIETQASCSYRCYRPLGPILAVMPWNYPIWQVIRVVAPALMAGNTVLLKHASNVPQCAIYLVDVFERAGFPKGSLQCLLIGGAKVERILRNARVKAATLTGSEPAGASVASICGQEIKPTVLELGGSDAFIVMPSADIVEAARIGTVSRIQNNGQSCIAAKRFIIHDDVFDDFKDCLIREFEARNVGDPLDNDTDVGPLVSEGSRKDIEQQIATAIEDGAKLLTGGYRLDRKGFFFKPGIIEGVSRTSRFFYDEIFGPVAVLYRVKSFDEALSLANDSPFGLSSSVWTNDKDEQMKAINDLDVGATFINSMTVSNPSLPFGGVKKSGYGRELAAEGIRTFCNIKTISIN